MAIHNEIQRQDSTEKKKELSVKHQVLCDETAMIGIMKQTEKATGELQETHIDFNREQSQPQFDINMDNIMQRFKCFSTVVGGGGGGGDPALFGSAMPPPPGAPPGGFFGGPAQQKPKKMGKIQVQYKQRRGVNVPGTPVTDPKDWFEIFIEDCFDAFKP